MARVKATRVFYRHFRWEEEVIVDADTHDDAFAKGRAQFSSRTRSPMPDNAKVTSEGAFDSSTFLPQDKQK